jgi:transcriptional regulator GlxA family with amidase domain
MTYRTAHVDTSARDCGIADEQALRCGFQTCVGITPAEYRERF